MLKLPTFLPILFLFLSNQMYSLDKMSYELEEDSQLFLKLPSHISVKFEYVETLKQNYTIGFESLDSDHFNVKVGKNSIGENEVIIDESEEGSAKVPVKVTVQSGGKLPVILLAEDVSVKLDKWIGDVIVNSQKGTLNSKASVGRLMAYFYNGNLEVVDHKGKLSVDGFKYKLVRVLGIKGDVFLENFMGETAISGVEGSLDIRGFKGNFVVDTITGNVNYTGINNLAKFKKINGTGVLSTQSGKLIVSLEEKSQFQIQSDSGEVKVFTKGVRSSFNVKVKTAKVQSGNIGMDSKPYRSWNRYIGRSSGKGSSVVSIESKTGNVFIF